MLGNESFSIIISLALLRLLLLQLLLLLLRHQLHRGLERDPGAGVTDDAPLRPPRPLLLLHHLLDVLLVVQLAPPHLPPAATPIPAARAAGEPGNTRMEFTYVKFRRNIKVTTTT